MPILTSAACKAIVMAVGVNHHAASYLNVFDRGCGIAFDELGFAVELHGLGRPIAGLYRNESVRLIAVTVPITCSMPP